MNKKRYICVGENFNSNVRIGFCGDVHTIEEWIKVLFPNNIGNVLKFFEGDTDKEIIDYFYKNLGKRLKRVKE